MRKNGKYWAVSFVSLALVATLVLACSPGFQNGESEQIGEGEQIEVTRQVEAGEQVQVLYGETSGEHGDGSEETGEHGGSFESEAGHSEGAGHAEGPGPGEESGQDLALTDVHDEVRNGARLQMVYDPETNAFRGIVQNTTNQTLCRVRVEVHLSNGTELGPTNPVNLPPGAMLGGELSAAGETFEGWSAHAETSLCVGGEGTGEHGLGGEHGTGSEGASEHGGSGEGAGEHSEGSD